MCDQINTFLHGSLQRMENYSLVKYLPAEIRYKIWKDFFEPFSLMDLVKNGILSLVKERLECDFGLEADENGEAYVETAITDGNLKMVKLLVEKGVMKRAPDYVFRKIINSNTQLEIIEYIHSLLSQPLTTASSCLAFEQAVIADRLDIVQFLHSEGCMDNISYATRYYLSTMSVQVGNLEMFKWFLETSNCHITPETADIACRYGHLHIVKWIHSHHPTVVYNRSAMDLACEHGHLDIAKFLHNHRSEGCTTKAMINACKNGHLETVIWLHFNRREISDACIDDAFDVLLLKYDIALIDFFLRCRKEKCSNAVFNCLALNASDKNLLMELYKRNPQLSISDHVIEMHSAFGNTDMMRFCSELAKT